MKPEIIDIGQYCSRYGLDAVVALIEKAEEIDTRRVAPIMSGGDFVLDYSKLRGDPLWGRDSSIVWSRGETLILCGPSGIAKTTLAQQIVNASLGVNGRHVLGMPVKCEGRWLYAALDRPLQIAVSWQRMITEEHRTVLNDGIVVHKGALPFNVIDYPAAFNDWINDHSAEYVIIDSLKDFAGPLSRDEVGAAVNQAFQIALADNKQLLVIHHLRKATTQDVGAKPSSLDDIYGSRWISDGSGSVVLLWGRAGDPIIEWDHLKQPVEMVGPFRIQHNHELGSSKILDQVDLVEVARHKGDDGLTVKDAAIALFATDKPEPNQIEKARRRLQSLVREGVLIGKEGARGFGGEKPTVYIYDLYGDAMRDSGDVSVKWVK